MVRRIPNTCSCLAFNQLTNHQYKPCQLKHAWRKRWAPVWLLRVRGLASPAGAPSPVFTRERLNTCARPFQCCPGQPQGA